MKEYGIEPSGIQIAGTMPDEIWYDELKDKLTVALGYEVREPEDGFEMFFFGEIRRRR